MVSLSECPSASRAWLGMQKMDNKYWLNIHSSSQQRLAEVNGWRNQRLSKPRFKSHSQPPSWEPSEALTPPLPRQFPQPSNTDNSTSCVSLEPGILLANDGVDDSLIFMEPTVLGCKHLGSLLITRDTPLRQALLLSPFYRWENLEGIVEEQVWEGTGPRGKKGKWGW